MTKRAIFLWPYVVGFQYALLSLFGITRFSWRHVGLWEVKRILYACLAGSALLMTVRLSAGYANASFLQYVQVPVGVIVIDSVLLLVGVTGIRVARRAAFEHYSRRLHRSDRAGDLPTLLIGAGQAGVMVAKEIANWPDLGIRPLGFIDDDPLKSGAVIHGLRVLGATDQLADVAQDVQAKQALITIANSDRRQIRRITELCKAANLPTKIIPGVFEIVGGRVNLSRIRDVAIQDLLGRQPVALEEASIRHVLFGRTVMVTGAAGSIGRELCLQVARFSPARLIMVDQNETGLFYAAREVENCDPSVDAVACIADICDEDRMDELFRNYRPDAVFHAAAYKHVGLMESNIRESIRNNVLGTRILAELAKRWSTRQFVLISTDKAVNPTSVMGACKRLAEMYVQALSTICTNTLYVAVRFGNVLGSAGSVIPIFTEQISKGGPITVTHPDMRRYFMTIEEASQLVLQAAGIGKGGEIFILDMGDPVRIVDLANDLVTLSGLRVPEDIEIVFTGIKAGEKLYEELSVAAEKVDTTRHSKIFIERISAPSLDSVGLQLDHLEAEIVRRVSLENLKVLLMRAVQEHDCLADGKVEETKPLKGPLVVAPAT